MSSGAKSVEDNYVRLRSPIHQRPRRAEVPSRHFPDQRKTLKGLLPEYSEGVAAAWPVSRPRGLSLPPPRPPWWASTRCWRASRTALNGTNLC